MAQLSQILFFIPRDTTLLVIPLAAKHCTGRKGTILSFLEH